MSEILNRLWSRSTPRKLILFLFLFVIIKALVYFTPVSISNITDRVSYGKFEYSLSLSMLLGGILTFGLSGVYSYYMLTLEKKQQEGMFFLHGLLLSALPVLFCLLYATGFIGIQFFSTVLLAIAFGQQLLLSFIYKTTGENVKAVIIDGGIYLAIAVGIGSYYAFGKSLSDDLFAMIWKASLAFNGTMGLVYFFKYRRAPGYIFSAEIYWQAIKRGLALLIAGTLMPLLTVSNRIYIEYFLGYSDVGVFAFYFRVVTAVVMIQQVINIVFFRNIFQSDLKKIDKYWALFLMGIFLASLSVFFVFPVVGSGWFQILDATYPQQKILFYILSAHVSFWITLSLIESLVNRVDIIRQSTIITAFTLVLMLGTMFLLYKFYKLDLEIMAGINVLALYLAAELQFLFIRRKTQISFRYIRLAHFCILIVGMTGYLLL